MSLAGLCSSHPFQNRGWVWDELETCLLTQDQSANNETEKENDRATFLFVSKEENGLLEEFLKMPDPLSIFLGFFPSVTLILRAWCFLVAQRCCKIGQVALLKLELELSPTRCPVSPGGDRRSECEDESGCCVHPHLPRHTALPCPGEGGLPTEEEE